MVSGTFLFQPRNQHQNLLLKQYLTPTFLLVWGYGSKENSRWEHVVHKGEPRKQELETLCRGHVVRGRGDRARKGT